MDEGAYRRTLQEVVSVPCPFEKAIQRRVCACPHAVKTNIAEREAVNCGSAESQVLCAELIHQTRKRANFALGLTETPGALPHAKAIKIQCGGLLGLQHTLDALETPDRVGNVISVIRRALKRFGDLDSLPYDKIMRFVATFEPRRRRPRPGR